MIESNGCTKWFLKKKSNWFIAEKRVKWAFWPLQRPYDFVLMVSWRFQGHTTSYSGLRENWDFWVFGQKMTKSGMGNTGEDRRSSNFTFDMITFRIGPFRNFFKKFSKNFFGSFKKYKNRTSNILRTKIFLTKRFSQAER